MNELEKTIAALNDYNKVLVSIQRLKSMLGWSDRLGTDEKAEIELIIKLLQEYGKK
jgi:hypothetical protein